VEPAPSQLTLPGEWSAYSVQTALLHEALRHWKQLRYKEKIAVDLSTWRLPASTPFLAVVISLTVQSKGNFATEAYTDSATWNTR
jgi:hypothetical protein